MAVVASPLIAWVACGVLTYGVTFAHFWHKYQTLQQMPGRAREVARFAALMALFGPMGLVIAWLMSGFALHGVMFSVPPPKREKGSGQ